MPRNPSNRSGSARAKLRAHFLANLGVVFESDELREIAGGISEWARRVRELRNEEGFQILTNNDLSELKPGQYVLREAKPHPAFERNISKELRAIVLDRNGFTCQMCGATAGEPHPYDSTRKTRLHIGHIKDKSMGGTDDASNLRAVCSVCNEGASNITTERPIYAKLKAQVSRAANDVQVELMNALIRKFPHQADAALNLTRK
ncbi:MAG: HNH endonuclease [Holophagaceae bacterium]|nr:HNH endonuclease [Holophagaceae bacterium]